MILGFLGSGSMAQAMARGFASAQPDTKPEMLFTDAGSGRAARLAEEVGGEALPSNADLAERSDLLVLGCKPKDLEKAGNEAGQAPVVLSLLGATPLEAVRSAFPRSEVHRAMPNLAVEVNRGVICLSEAPGRSRAAIADLLSSLGDVVDLPDELLDPATAVMGCSPAYIDLLAESLVAAGVDAGLDSDLASRMVLSTVSGTAALLADRRPGELSRAVASPGGSTEAGLRSLASDRFPAVVARAVEASLARMRGES